MQKIIPNIWSDGQAEQAADFYTSIFGGGKIHTTSHYTEVGQEFHGQQPGSVMTVEFEIEGYRMILLNGGSAFQPNPSISFFVNYQDRQKVDELWAALMDGGRALMELKEYPFSKWYGWVEDKYGVSWQLSQAEGPAETLYPSLMFVGDMAGKAEEAIEYYTSLFKRSKKGEYFRYQEGQEPDVPGTIAYADFRLEDQLFAVMDSARKHDFTFSEGVSLMINCDDQAEIDHYWQLSAVPESEQCGWLKDKYGVSWQVNAAGWDEMMKDPESPGAKRAMAALFAMKKLDIAKLEKAYRGE